MKNFIAVGCLFLMLTTISYADMGMVPPPDVWVYEPGQKAIIGFNGTDEVLILSVDLYASKNTTVLSILPLPSEPKAEAGSFDSFVKVQQLLDEHDYLGRGMGPIVPMAAGEKAMSVEVLFHEQIGAHDITAVKTTSTDEFINWANGFLTGKGVNFQITSQEVKNAVADYIDRGLNYFVFDLTEISEYTTSREPVVYTFKSDSLYFPLKISSLSEGVTSINLFTITYDAPGKANFTAINFIDPIQFTITSEDMLEIDERIADLFHSTTHMTSTAYHGYLDELDKDVNIEMKPVLTSVQQLEQQFNQQIQDLQNAVQELRIEVEKSKAMSLTGLAVGIALGIIVAVLILSLIEKKK